MSCACAGLSLRRGLKLRKLRKCTVLRFGDAPIDAPGPAAHTQIMAQNGLCRERHLPLQHAVIRHPLQPALITCASHCGAGLQPCKKIVILPDLPVFHAQRDIPQTQLLQAFLRKAGLFPQLPQSTGPRVRSIRPAQNGRLRRTRTALPRGSRPGTASAVSPPGKGIPQSYSAASQPWRFPPSGALLHANVSSITRAARFFKPDSLFHLGKELLFRQGASEQAFGPVRRARRSSPQLRFKRPAPARGAHSIV